MELNKYIDHTILKADSTKKDIDNIIKDAIKYNFKTICINPTWINYASKKLSKYPEIGITTVIGFPLGANTTETKVFEAKDAIDKGADEIDMVMNIGKFKDKDFDYTLNEINSIKEAIGKDHLLKVIVETALLNEKEIIKITQIVDKSNADFIKTSTGFSTRGASFKDIEIMKLNIKGATLIKAAGGISNSEDLKKMIDLGADRIGTSRGVSLIKGLETKEGY